MLCSYSIQELKTKSFSSLKEASTIVASSRKCTSLIKRMDFLLKKITVNIQKQIKRDLLHLCQFSFRIARTPCKCLFHSILVTILVNKKNFIKLKIYILFRPVFSVLTISSVADQGGTRDTPPQSKFFHSHAVFGKKSNYYIGVPPPPPGCQPCRKS